MKALEGLELVRYACGESAGCDVADVAQKVLDANLLCFLGLDNRCSVDECLGCGCAVLRFKKIGSVLAIRSRSRTTP